MNKWHGTGISETLKLRKKVTNLGKQIASENGDKDFPDWLNFKVGICSLKGIPYKLNRDYYLGWLEPGGDCESTDD